MEVEKTFFDGIELESETDRSKVYQLEYYLLEKSVKVDGFSLNTFGVEILKRTQVDGETTNIEYHKVFDVFCSRAEAGECLRKLVRNCVTPVSLLEVLQDMIGIGDLVNEEMSLDESSNFPDESVV